MENVYFKLNRYLLAQKQALYYQAKEPWHHPASCAFESLARAQIHCVLKQVIFFFKVLTSNVYLFIPIECFANPKSDWDVEEMGCPQSLFKNPLGRFHPGTYILCWCFFFNLNEMLLERKIKRQVFYNSFIYKDWEDRIKGWLNYCGW